MSRKIQSDSVKTNMIYLSTYQVLSILLPFITTPYINRILGTEGVGIYSWSNAIVYFFVVFANLGISNYGNREIAISINDEDKLSKTFFEIYFCHLSVSCLSTILFIVYYLLFVHEHRIIFLCQGIQVLSACIDITWFFTGIQRFKITVFRNILVRIITFISIFAFVKTSGDLWKYVAILSIGHFVGYCLLWGQARKYIHYVPIRITDLFIHLKPMLILFLPIIAMSIYRYIDKIMIPIFSNIDEVCLYENSEKIIIIPLSIITSIGAVLLPKMSNLVSIGANDIQKKYYKLI